MGGVKTDLRGATTIPGLFAAGEAACTGVHGANRLASNSLLEGLVYGERAGMAAARYGTRRRQERSWQRPHPAPEQERFSPPAALDIDAIRRSLRKLMWEKVGIVRNGKDLSAAFRQLRAWDRVMKDAPLDRGLLELRNMISASMLIARSALQREGSVGAHFRSDFPNKGKNWRKRIVMTKQA
jgi:L-aspartate oxidase